MAGQRIAIKENSTAGASGEEQFEMTTVWSVTWIGEGLTGTTTVEIDEFQSCWAGTGNEKEWTLIESRTIDSSNNEVTVSDINPVAGLRVRVPTNPGGNVTAIIKWQ